jgi:hypothetical protein
VLEKSADGIMEAASSLRTIPVYRPTWRHIPEDWNLGIQRLLVNLFRSHEIRFFFWYSENVNSGVLGCDTVHISLVGTISFWSNLQPLWRSQWEGGGIDPPPH